MRTTYCLVILALALGPVTTLIVDDKDVTATIKDGVMTVNNGAGPTLGTLKRRGKGVGSRLLTAVGDSVRFVVCHDDFERLLAGLSITCSTARWGG